MSPCSKSRGAWRAARGIALGVGFALAAAGHLDVRAQVSPGPLARAHRDLEGNLNCLQCHRAGEASQDGRCLDCHQEIAWLVGHDRGLHGALDEECASCHPDHAGLDFELIAWEEGAPERFAHARSGWPLEGKHARVKCRDCHKPEYQSGPVLPLRKSRDPSRSWLGLERDCVSCHEDFHRGALGGDCVSCHGMEGWKPAPRFDHAKTAFPLTGKHGPVECDKCHLAASLELARDDQGRRTPLYKPLPHEECSACHRDPHDARLGPKCAGCHTADGWQEVERKGFDHSRTRYPLTGRHVGLECSACHDPERAGGARPAFDRCGACHADAHAGTATLAGKNVDCASCHGLKGFTPSTYTVARHDASLYPLVGKHRDVSCDRCHPKNPQGSASKRLGAAGVLLRRDHERCRDCHEEAHAKQLARRPDGGACDACHNLEGWKPSTYTVARHAELALPLDGRHAAVECRACHGPERRGLPPLPGPREIGSAGVLLAPLNPGCASCHQDPHAGRFAKGGARPQEGGCHACHSAERFRPAHVDVVVHGTFDYRLEGAHRAVPCVDCHAELKLPPSEAKLLETATLRRALPFSARHERCEDCHENPHGDQFAHRSDSGTCEACHGGAAFRPAGGFDHARTEFPLDGSHRKVACEKCHPSPEKLAGEPQVLYRPIPHRCQDCHGPRAPKPVEAPGNASASAWRTGGAP